MDKETLSQYGWVIIVIIVLAIMIGLATPFGNFVKQSVDNTIHSFGQKVVMSLEAADVDVPENGNSSNGGSSSGDVDGPGDLNGEGNDSGEVGIPDTPNREDVTTEVSDNVIAASTDFYSWSTETTKIEFGNNYSNELIITEDTYLVETDSEYAYDISEAGDGSVVVYLTTEGDDTVLHIAGKDGVVMANEDSSCLFAELENVESINFNNSFNTQNVKNFSQMFLSCLSLKGLDLSSFNTVNATDMSEIFAACPALKNIDLSSFDTSNVVNMRMMFFGCFALESIDVSNFNTSNVEDMAFMFAGCRAITELDLTSFNTLKVLNMGGMFYSAQNLKVLDLSSFDTRNVSAMKEMFADCLAMEHIYVGDNWTTEGAEYEWGFAIEDMFLNCGVSAVEKKNA